MIKKTILMIGSDISVKGGMTTVVKQFLSNFEKEEIKFIPTHIEGPVIYKIIFFLVALIRIVKNLLFNNIDLVHMHVSERGSFFRKYVIYKITKLLKKKVIIHMHGAEFEEFYYKSSVRIKKRICEFLKNSDRVLVLGNRWNEIIKAIEPDSNTFILRNAVNIPKNKAEYNNEVFNILFLAVLEQRKGVYDLLKGIKILVDDKKFNEQFKFRLLIAGTGEEENKLKVVVDNLKINKNVEFLGWVDSEYKDKLLSSAQLFILPSYNEGLPMSILEALSYGIPTISTNVGSIEEAVINDYNGYTIEPGNYELLSKYMKMIISNKKLWRRLSINARIMATNNYNLEDYMQKVNKIYDEMVDNIYV